MPRFKITVTETVLRRFDTVEIKANDEEEARDIAEEMRVQGQLGEACEWTDDVEITTRTII